MNLQLPRCTAGMSPYRWWALTPPSHPYLACARRFFSSALLNPHGLLLIRKWDALGCPDFPLSDDNDICLLHTFSDRLSNCFRFSLCKFSNYKADIKEFLDLFLFHIVLFNSIFQSLLIVFLFYFPFGIFVGISIIDRR